MNTKIVAQKSRAKVLKIKTSKQTPQQMAAVPCMMLLW